MRKDSGHITSREGKFKGREEGWWEAILVSLYL